MNTDVVSEPLTWPVCGACGHADEHDALGGCVALPWGYDSAGGIWCDGYCGCPLDRLIAAACEAVA